jgi:hypothetical protein
MKTWKGSVALCLLIVGQAALAATPDVDSTKATVLAIQATYRAEQSTFATPTAQAVNVLETTLIRQYGARGRLSAEPDADLKELYYESATLLMNGDVVAGGTLVNFARRTPAMLRSPSGAALGQFVDAMLQPSDESDSDLVIYQKQTKAAIAGLGHLSSVLRVPAQVLLVGEIYNDPIAVKSGHKVLDDLHATANDWDIINKARDAGRRFKAPAGADDE